MIEKTFSVPAKGPRVLNAGARVAGGVLFACGIAALYADTSAVNGFGSGGWNADDVRNTAGTNITNSSTHAPGSGAMLDDAGVAAQIDWRNAIGTLGNLGGVALTGTSTGGGKSTISVVNTGAGLADSASALGENFSAIYRWQNTDTVAAGVSFKIGVQSTAWSASQSGFTASRSGEATWDLLLVYDPTQPGNTPGNTTTNGAFVTATVNATTSKFFLFGQAANAYHVDIPGGSVAKTLTEWAADPVWGALLFGEGAKITNTQFGFGSGNANASGVLDYAAVSYLNSGDRIDFVDAARYTGPGSDFGDSSNWGGTTPSSAQNLVVDQDATLAISGTQNARSLGVLAGTTGIVLSEGATLVLNQAENGTLSVDAGATAGVTGTGTLQAAVIEAGGTLNLATVTLLDGGASPHPVRDGGSSATSRYGLVVLNGGEVNLRSGADVRLANNTGVNGFKAMIRVGEVSGAAGPGVLNIEEGASLRLGSLHGSGSWGALHVGDWGGEGEVNQTGGTVDIFGALMIGNEGGTGTYTISDGALNIYRPVDDNGAIILGRATNNRASDGTFNIDGGTVTIGAAGGANGNVALVIGGISDNVPAYANGRGTVNQTGGEVRFENGVLKFGRGNGTYNLNGGVLAIGGTNAISATANGVYAFNFGGGTLKVINSALTTSIDASLTAGKWSYIDTNGLGATWSGDIDGAGGGLVKQGLGALTFAGNATREIGSFKVEGGSAVQTNGTSTFSEFAMGTGAGNSGSFTLDGGTVILAGHPPFSSPGAASSFRVGDFGGTGVFNQNGGTVIVGSAENAAALNIGNQGGSGTYNLNGGTLELHQGLHVVGRSDTSRPASQGILNITGGLLNVKSGGSLFLGNNVTNPNSGFSATLNQSGGILRFDAGTNFYQSAFSTGTYNLTGGVLEIGGDSFKATYNGHGDGGTFNFAGGTIKVIDSDLVTSVRAVLADETVSTINTDGKNATFSDGFGGTGGFAKTGAGALTLNGTTHLQSASTVSGVLKIGAGAGKNGTLTLSDALSVIITNGVGRLQIGVDGGTGVANFTEGASFKIDDAAKTSGWGTFDVGRGAGSTGTVNHSAGIADISGGALQIGYSGATGTYALTGDAELTLGEASSLFIGSGAGANGLLTIADDAVFSTAGQVFVGAGTGATGTITQTGGSATFAGTTAWFGTDSDETSNAPGAGIYNLSGGMLTFDGVTNGVRFGDHASGGSGVFNQTGGTVAVLGTTLRVGAHGTYNQSGGVLEIGGNNLTGSGAYKLGGGKIKVVGSALTTGMNATLTAGKVLTIDTNGLGAIFSGSLTGGGGVTKSGEGELRFTGESDYLGATVVEAGVFRVDGVLANSAVTVRSGATITGHGTAAAVYIETGGRLNLGDDIGVFTVTGDLDLSEGSLTLLRIAGVGSFDRLRVDGTLFAGGILDVRFGDGFDALEGQSFDLIDAGSFDGVFAEVWLPTLGAGLEWDTGGLYATGEISVIASAIPEPATWVSLAGGFALLAALVKRRRRAAA